MNNRIATFSVFQFESKQTILLGNENTKFVGLFEPIDDEHEQEEAVKKSLGYQKIFIAFE